MIDWFSLAFNTFWIFGLAIMLAAFSYHYWLASLEGRKLKEQLDRPAFLRFFWAGFVLISIGLIGTSQRAWETVIWIIFLLISTVNAFMMIRTGNDK